MAIQIMVNTVMVFRASGNGYGFFLHVPYPFEKLPILLVGSAFANRMRRLIGDVSCGVHQSKPQCFGAVETQ